MSATSTSRPTNPALRTVRVRYPKLPPIEDPADGCVLVRVRNNKQPAKDSSDHSSNLLTLPQAERDLQPSHTLPLARRSRLDTVGAADNSSKNKPKQNHKQTTKSDRGYHISNYPCKYKYDHYQISVPPPHHRSDSSSTATSSASGSSGSSSPPTEPPDNETTQKMDIEEACGVDDAVEREDSPALEGDGGFPTGEGYPGTVRWVYCYD
ncbi:hypothetical protein JCM24511_08311 [Saitozyma sp. JCM 24511]|nr:hypothetical protein JCM24511_08311 [Saitozyma sp. JCM 24511]